MSSASTSGPHTSVIGTVSAPVRARPGLQGPRVCLVQALCATSIHSHTLCAASVVDCDYTLYVHGLYAACGV